MPAAVATAVLKAVGRCLPLGSLAASFAVVVAKPDSSDMWMLSGVILSMLPTLADVGKTSGKRLFSKLGGTLAFGMFCPLAGYRLFQHNAVVKDLAEIGWTWLAAGFAFGMLGWAVAKAVFSVIDQKVIRRLYKIAGTPQEDVRPDTNFLPESMQLNRNPLEDSSHARTPGDDHGTSN
jgi:hypothetical protein